MGSAAAIGAGYFPTVLSLLVLALGLAIGIGGALRPREGVDAGRARPLVMLLTAVACFAFAAEDLGFVVATVLLVVVGSMADHDWRWREALISSVALAAFGVLVFIVGLGVPIKIGPF